MRRYRIGAAMLAGFVMLVAAGGFARAASVQPWMGSPNTPISQLGSFGHLFVERGSSLALAFGAKGTASTDIVVPTIAVPAYPGLSVTPEQDGCTSTQDGAVQCPGPLTDGVLYGDARLHTTSATPLGYAGLVTVSVSGDSVSIQLWVISAHEGADFEVRSADVIARAGDTVPMTVTVSNHGPNAQPYWGITDLTLPGARLVGQHGCSPGVLAGQTWQCLYTNFTPAGATILVTFDVKILAAPTVGTTFAFSMVTYLTDPNPSNQPLYVRVLGGSGSGGTDGSGRSGVTGDSGHAGPTSSASTGASASPVVPSASATDSQIAPAADTSPRTATPSSTPLPWYLGGVLVLVLAAGGLLARRRRRPGGTSTEVEPADGAVSGSSTREAGGETASRSGS